MNYLIVENGIIVNIITADEIFASKMGALPWYEGADIGTIYISQPTETEKLRADIDYIAMETGVALDA